MHFNSVALGLVFAGLVSSPAFSASVPASLGAPAPARLDAQDAGPMPSKPANAGEQVAPDTKTSSFGSPLYVNGRRISDNQIKAYLLYGPCRLMFEMYRVGLIIEDELLRRAQDAAAPEIAKREAQKPFASDAERKKAFDAEVKSQNALLHEQFSPSEDDYQTEYDSTIEDFKKNYPVLNVPAEIARAFRSVDWYAQQLRQALLFDNVFLPPNPDDWPIVTLEAVRADTPGDVLLEDARMGFKMRSEQQARVGGALPKEDSIYTNMMRQIVRDAMFGLVDFKTAFDGLPDGMALSADTNGDGKPELAVTIDEMWSKVADTITPSEIEEAKQWFMAYYATRDRLEKEGFLLSQDDCNASLATLGKQFENTHFSLELMASHTYYFPSVETFKKWWCLKEGFAASMEPKLQPGPGGDLAPPLREHYDKANKIMGLAQVDVEVLLVSAMDIPAFKWKPNGWAWAEKTSKEIKAQIDANVKAVNEQTRARVEAQARGEEYKPEHELLEPYRFWSQMMDDHSEYWDPPPPEKGRGSDVGWKKKGRFGLKYRNDLLGTIGETPFRVWITGDSITDYTFFEQAEGSVSEPMKGPLGYYITRVKSRTPPTRPLNLSQPKHVQMLKDDYLRVAFVQFAKESVAQADIKGR